MLKCIFSAVSVAFPWNFGVNFGNVENFSVFFGMSCEYSSHWRLRTIFPSSSPSIYLPHRCDTQARLSLLMTPKRCALSPIEAKMQDNGNGNPHFQCKKKKLHRPFESNRQWDTLDTESNNGQPFRDRSDKRETILKSVTFLYWFLFSFVKVFARRKCHSNVANVRKSAD